MYNHISQKYYCILFSSFIRYASVVEILQVQTTVPLERNRELQEREDRSESDAALALLSCDQVNIEFQ